MVKRIRRRYLKYDGQVAEMSFVRNIKLRFVFEQLAYRQRVGTEG